LRQLEDLQVDSHNASESGKETVERQPSNVPTDVEMRNVKNNTHIDYADTSLMPQNGEEDIQTHHLTSLPPIDRIINMLPMEEEDELAQDDESPEDMQDPPSPYDHDDYWISIRKRPPSSGCL